MTRHLTLQTTNETGSLGMMVGLFDADTEKELELASCQQETECDVIRNGCNRRAAE